LVVLTAPFIYVLIVPLVLLDLFVSLYQAVCFPVYGISKVPRGDHIVIDRQHLAYLNGLQKLNCIYCGYANGLIGWVREVASRTETFWCPIKHSRPVKGPHRRYHRFVEFGDHRAFREDVLSVDCSRSGHLKEHRHRNHQTAQADRMTRLRKALLFGAMATLALLLAACAFYKPLRVVTPETFGLTCVTDTLCVEEMSTVPEATQLRDGALRFVTENVGQIYHPPARSLL
jgi:hypothetical protein